MTERCPTCSRPDCPSIASRIGLERALKANMNAATDEASAWDANARATHAAATTGCRAWAAANPPVPLATRLDPAAPVTQAGLLWAPPGATPEDIVRRQRVADALSHKPKNRPRRRKS